MKIVLVLKSIFAVPLFKKVARKFVFSHIRKYVKTTENPHDDLAAEIAIKMIQGDIFIADDLSKYIKSMAEKYPESTSWQTVKSMVIAE